MEFGEHNRRLVQKVTKLEPDMIALTGDFIESPEDLPVVAALVSELSQIAPVYFSSGNHDWGSGVINEVKDTIWKVTNTVISEFFSE